MELLSPFRIIEERRRRRGVCPQTPTKRELPQRELAMDIFVENHLSDDQWALIGCVAALMLCGTFMSLSHFIGQARKASIRKAFGKINAGHGSAKETPARKSGRKAA